MSVVQHDGETPDEADVLTSAIQNMIDRIKVGAPGTVTSFDGAVCNVKLDQAAPIGMDDGSVAHLEYPELQNVPILWPCSVGAKFAMTFPLEVGDAVYCFISDLPISHWQGNRDQKVPDRRRHHIDGAVCIPGCLTNEEGDGLFSSEMLNQFVIGHRDGCQIGIEEDCINFGSLDPNDTLAVTAKLVARFQALEQKVNILLGIAHAHPPPGGPVNLLPPANAPLSITTSNDIKAEKLKAD